MDGRHFAEEFVRRKRLADKGIVEKQPAAKTAAGGVHGGSGKNDNEGWSEVAKKGGASGHKDDSAIPGGQFRVVPGRKKGKK